MALGERERRDGRWDDALRRWSPGRSRRSLSLTLEGGRGRRGSPPRVGLLRRRCSGACGTLRSGDTSRPPIPAGNRPLRGRSAFIGPSGTTPSVPARARRLALHYAPRPTERQSCAEGGPPARAGEDHHAIGGGPSAVPPSGPCAKATLRVVGAPGWRYRVRSVGSRLLTLSKAGSSLMHSGYLAYQRSRNHA